MASLTRGVRRLRGQRPIAFVSGLVLVLVPTVFTIAPGFAKWNGWWRVAIAGGWIVAAAIAVVASLQQATDVERVVGAAAQQDRLQRLGAIIEVLKLLLGHPPGDLRRFGVQLFLIDRTSDRLRAWNGDEEEWAVGNGATGYSYFNQDQVIARGTTVHDGSYGLSPEQQQRYAELRCVVATPVTSSDDHRLGVLTFYSATDSASLRSEEGLEAQLRLALVISRLLEDVLGGQVEELLSHRAATLEA
jgi:hypothetical protein